MPSWYLLVIVFSEFSRKTFLPINSRIKVAPAIAIVGARKDLKFEIGSLRFEIGSQRFKIFLIFLSFRFSISNLKLPILNSNKFLSIFLNVHSL